MAVNSYTPHECNSAEFFNIVTSLGKGKVVIRESVKEPDTYIPVSERPKTWLGRIFAPLRHIGSKKRKAKNVTLFLDQFFDKNKDKERIVSWNEETPAKKISKLYFDEKASLDSLAHRYKNSPVSEKIKEAIDILDTAYREALQNKTSNREGILKEIGRVSKKHTKELKKKETQFEKEEEQAFEALKEEGNRLRKKEKKYQQVIKDQEEELLKIKEVLKEKGENLEEELEIATKRYERDRKRLGEMEEGNNAEKLNTKVAERKQEKERLEQLLYYHSQLTKGEQLLDEAKIKLQKVKLEITELTENKEKLRLEIIKEDGRKADLDDKQTSVRMRCGKIVSEGGETKHLDYSEEYKDDQFKDIVFHCRDNGKIYAHKFLIQDVKWIEAQDGGFKEESEMCEDGKSRKVLDMTKYSKETIDCFLKFKYRVKQDEQKILENCGELFEFTKEYDLTRLRIQCENAVRKYWTERLQEGDSEELMKEIFDWLDSGYEEMEEMAFSFLTKNPTGIRLLMESGKFDDLSHKEKIKILSEIDLKNISAEKEEEIIKFVNTLLNAPDKEMQNSALTILLNFDSCLPIIFTSYHALSLNEDQMRKFILKALSMDDSGVPLLCRLLYADEYKGENGEKVLIEFKERFASFVRSWGLTQGFYELNHYNQSIVKYNLCRFNFFGNYDEFKRKIIEFYYNINITGKLTPQFCKDALEDLFVVKMSNVEEAIDWVTNKTLPILYYNPAMRFPINEYKKCTNLLENSEYVRVFQLSEKPAERVLNDSDKALADDLQKALYPRVCEQAFATVATHFTHIVKSNSLSRFSAEDLKTIMNHQNFPAYEEPSKRFEILISWALSKATNEEGEQDLEYARSLLLEGNISEEKTYLTEEQYAEFLKLHPDLLEQSHEATKKSKGKEKQKV